MKTESVPAGFEINIVSLLRVRFVTGDITFYRGIASRLEVLASSHSTLMLSVEVVLWTCCIIQPPRSTHPQLIQYFGPVPLLQLRWWYVLLIFIVVRRNTGPYSCGISSFARRASILSGFAGTGTFFIWSVCKNGTFPILTKQRSVANLSEQKKSTALW